MATGRTSLLNLPLPTEGELDGSWGDMVNKGLTEYLDIAIAGVDSLTSANFTAGALTLANTTGTDLATNIAATSAQYATLRVSSLVTNSTITAPSSSRSYRIINADATYSLTIKASGQTGVTFSAGQTGIVAYDGTDYALVGTIGPTVPVARGGTGATTLTGVLKGNGTSPFTASNVSLSSEVTGTLPAANGGTGVANGSNNTITFTGNYTLGLTLSNNTAVTLPTTGTLATLAGTETLTNKRITPRANITTTTSSPWAWNSNSYDIQGFTALANALTINADAGTPTDGQRTTFRIKDNGTARALTWTTGSSKAFRAIGVTLPTTTVINKTVYVGCIYNAADDRWDAVAVAQEA